MTTTQSTQTIAQQLLADPAMRFTVREIGRGDLRKRMTAARFLAKRSQYVAEGCQHAGRPGIRVDVLNTANGTTQTWDLSLTKRYWA